jgi:two-component system, chemotaxis family, chemotaxis protein CheY
MALYSDLSYLVIDDNRHMRAIVRVLLEALDVHAIRECVDSSSAFDIFRETPADILIVSHQMTSLSGIEFTRRVRRSPESPFPQVPIILLTGHTERRRILEARDAGVSEILAKPVTANDLRSRLETILKRPRPFIYEQSYCGPCRRRHRDPDYGGAERRNTIVTATETVFLPELSTKS